MTRSALADILAFRVGDLPHRDVDSIVRLMVEECARSLERGERIEIRGFGSFALRHHPARMARNPATGEGVRVGAKMTVHFRAGQAMQRLIAASANRR